MENYNLSVKLRDKEVKFRKWKIKDKVKFKENEDKIEAFFNLVSDSLENKDIILTPEEFRYVLIKMRELSISDTISFELTCNECEEPYMFLGNLDEIIKPNFEKYKEIKYKDISIKLGDIPNKEYYEDSLKQCTTNEQIFLVDFLYHIKELNGSDAFSFDSLFDYINELDIDAGEYILGEWQKIKFTIDDIYPIKCPHCGNEELYEFDSFQDFLPENWY